MPKKRRQSNRIVLKRFDYYYLCFVFILARLFYWQIIKGQELRDKATSQLYRLEKIIPQQGHLLASDSFPLVSITLTIPVFL